MHTWTAHALYRAIHVVVFLLVLNAILGVGPTKPVFFAAPSSEQQDLPDDDKMDVTDDLYIIKNGKQYYYGSKR